LLAAEIRDGDTVQVDLVEGADRLELRSVREAAAA
jgi:hypothetical protein